MGSLSVLMKEGGEELVMGNGRRARVLCLHGFRTSADILRKQLEGKWPDSIAARFDFVFADAPFPAEGKSDVEGFFPPPYYEWFQFDEDFMEYKNFGKCLDYIENLLINYGPFDGMLGFSQGAILSAALPSFQTKGLALTKVPKIKFVIIIGGATFMSPTMAEKAYASMIKCPSLHFLGEMDFLKTRGEALLKAFIEPFIIRHPKGHIVPKLDEKGLEIMLSFLERIEKELFDDAPIVKEKFDLKE